MKNIKVYNADKYKQDKYEKVLDNIYKAYDNFTQCEMYYTSITFEQEPELGEGLSNTDISQYPLGDIVYALKLVIDDVYPDLNIGENNICTLEFNAYEIKFVEKLLNLVGKHVYNEECVEDNELVVKLVID